MTTTTAPRYPVQVDATLDSHLSRWLWLVKWILAVPHYLVLALLWPAFVVLSLLALVSILVTGRYPRTIFDFNVGVLRWSWRVSYYAFGALGTDRYPPFTLAEVPDYPAHLAVDHPAQLSRGLVLVKWLLVLPHYLVVVVFLGGGVWVLDRADDGRLALPGGLIGLVVLIAAVTLAATARYPGGIFDLVLGMNRWVLRVAGYTALMTDRYPPFRLDLGGHEPTAELDLTGRGDRAVGLDQPLPAAPSSAPAPPAAAAATAPATQHPSTSHWRTGQVVSVVAGSLVGVVSVGVLAAGVALTWVDRYDRTDGYVSSSPTSISTDSYALTQPVDLADLDLGAVTPTTWLGDVRVRASSADGGELFVGIASTADVDRYLAGVAHEVLDGDGARAGDGATTTGAAPVASPAGSDIWVASATGAGQLSVVWPAEGGRWSLVVMNADAEAGVVAQADVGATVPGLPWVAGGFLGAGLLGLVVAVVLVLVPVRRAARPLGQADAVRVP